MAKPQKASTMTRTAIHAYSFIVLVVVITAAFVWLMLPYYGAVLWAVILAILFNPIQRRLSIRLRGRRSLAATISVLACIVLAVVPAILIVVSLTREVSSLYRRFTASDFSLADMLVQGQELLPDFALNLLSNAGLGNIADIQESLVSGLAQASEVIAPRLIGAGQGTIQILINLAIMLYLLFFLFRDGNSLAHTVRRMIPLDDNRTDQITNKFVSVVKATVRGNVLIALIQGGLGGLTFGLLGLEAPFLWGVVMAILSLLPAVGAFLVWGPFAVYLFASEDYVRGTILVAVGALVIGMIDNVLRPILVGRETRLPDYVVLISTLGGLSLIGMNGFVLGPLIAALFIAVWSQFTDDRLQSPETSTDQPPAA